jgi:hypothetical protein
LAKIEYLGWLRARVAYYTLNTFDPSKKFQRLPYDFHTKNYDQYACGATVKIAIASLFGETSAWRYTRA